MPQSDKEVKQSGHQSCHLASALAVAEVSPTALRADGLSKMSGSRQSCCQYISVLLCCDLPCRTVRVCHIRKNQQTPGDRAVASVACQSPKAMRPWQRVGTGLMGT